MLIAGDRNILKPCTRSPSPQSTRPHVNWPHLQFPVSALPSLVLLQLRCLLVFLENVKTSCHRGSPWPFHWPFPSGSSCVLFISFWSFGSTALLGLSWPSYLKLYQNLWSITTKSSFSLWHPVFPEIIYLFLNFLSSPLELRFSSGTWLVMFTPASLTTRPALGTQ